MDNHSLTVTQRQIYTRIPSSDQHVELTQLKTFRKSACRVLESAKPTLIDESSTREKEYPQHSSWRKGVLISATLSAVVFFVNLGVLIWFTRAPLSVEGLTQLYQGSCSEVNSMDLWLHLIINILSTLLLGATNYCMQCLTAPTRRELDDAHQRGQWLDIGILSGRNLRRFTATRTLVWLLLGLTSVPLHLLFNSAIYSASQNNEYQVFYVDQTFPTGTAYDIGPIYNQTGYTFYKDFVDPKGAQELAAPWVRLDIKDCVDAYARYYLKQYRNLVVVTHNRSAIVPLVNCSENVYNSPGVNATWCQGCDNGACGSIIDAEMAYPGGWGYKWMCTGWPEFQNSYCFDEVDTMRAKAAEFRPEGYSVDYCIAEKAEEMCTLHGSILILSIVVACNLAKALVLFSVAIRLRGQPLVVVGDAVKSFLQVPDSTTRGCCLLTREDVMKGHVWPGTVHHLDSTKKARIPAQRRWQSMEGQRFWISVATLVCTTSALLGIFLWVYVHFRTGAIVSSTRQLQSYNVFTNGAVFNRGWGTVNPFSMLAAVGWPDYNLIAKPGSANFQVLASILVANLPQTVLSLFYVVINRHLTAIYLADEWNDFVEHRKGLRVSDPQIGTAQRSTYFLQLPYKVAVPFMAISVLLHWLLTSSIFLAIVRDYDPRGKYLDGIFAFSGSGQFSPGDLDQTADYVQDTWIYASLGISVAPMIFVLVTMAVLIMCLVGVSTRKLRPGMPLVGSCSAAISAACHAPQWDRGAEGKPLLWGVVEHPTDQEPGHASFSSGSVEKIDPESTYA